MSLDERETVHPDDATSLFFDELGTEADDEAVSFPGYQRFSDAEVPPSVGVDWSPVATTTVAAPTATPTPVSTGRHARRAAEVPATNGHRAARVADSNGVDVLGAPTSGPSLTQVAPRRGVEREGRRKRRRRRMLLAIVAVLLLVIGLAGWVGYRSFSSKPVADWSGSGSGSVIIQIHQGDGAGTIGATLLKFGVVRSVEAYTRASANNDKSGTIAPGSYDMHLQMSGKAAVDRLLDPAAHLVSKVVVPEGTIEKDIIAKIATALKLPPDQVAAAAADIPNIGLPEGYAPAGGGALTTAEGFLFPDTYSLDPGSTPAAALQQMAAVFTTVDREIGFADGAKKIGLTPYQALIIASMAQSEAKFDADAAKVARVILNRLAIDMPLQIDATSVYGAKIKGLDPKTTNYATFDSPYNTYLHKGLPPAPISNPGENMMKAAITPDDGNWLYYVNADAAGNLFFTNDHDAFEVAVTQCRNNNWGCG